eukprot:1854005-Pleurochrysis_carterae.AAC.5
MDHVANFLNALVKKTGICDVPTMVTARALPWRFGAHPLQVCDNRMRYLDQHAAVQNNASVDSTKYKLCYR